MVFLWVPYSIGKSTDPIFATVKTRLHPLLDSIRRILADIDAGLRDKELMAEN